MEILPILYDSFSTRSMFTFVKTDVEILIDPSIAIGPYRYGLKPHEIELKELEKGKEKILSFDNNNSLIIITHYHWDHCPKPNEKHFKILFNKTVFLKDINKNINNSQKFRGNNVYNLIKNKSNVIFADNKDVKIGNTYIKFYVGYHGEYNSKLGFVLIPRIEYKNKVFLFGSDIQGILNDHNLEIILDSDPDILIFSGPPIYHEYYDKKNDDIFIKNLIKVCERTRLKEIVVDHHSARSKDFKLYLEKIKNNLEVFGVSVYDGASYIGIEGKYLEANRDILYKNYFINID